MIFFTYLLIYVYFVICYLMAAETLAHTLRTLLEEKKYCVKTNVLSVLTFYEI